VTGEPLTIVPQRRGIPKMREGRRAR